MSPAQKLVKFIIEELNVPANIAFRMVCDLKIEYSDDIDWDKEEKKNDNR